MVLREELIAEMKKSFDENKVEVDKLVMLLHQGKISLSEFLTITKSIDNE